MDLSQEMYDRLVGLISDARVAAVNAKNEVQLLRQERDRDYKEIKGQILFLSEGQRVVSEDLTKVQSALREQEGAFVAQAEATDAMAHELCKLTQAVDGITQLTKSNFDQLESFRKQVIDGEAGTISHGDHIAGRTQ